MYDYYLGGSNNFSVDRSLARRVVAAVPDTPLQAQANRAFLRRVVRYLVGAGVRQFLDIGSGIPTVGNVHEIAQSLAADCRVVYVDIDPVAVAHAQSLLVSNDRAAAIEGDLRRPDAILDHFLVRDVIDFGQPVALLMLAVLHFVPEEADPAGIIARFRGVMVPGSYLALSVLSSHYRVPEEAEAGEAAYRDANTPLTVRHIDDIERLLDGFDLVPPGVVALPRWRPDPAELAPDEEIRSVFVGAVGRLP